jgi:hypothetical protein
MNGFRGSSVLSPKDIKASSKSHGPPSWKRVEHFEDKSGRKVDIFHDEPDQARLWPMNCLTRLLLSPLVRNYGDVFFGDQSSRGSQAFGVDLGQKCAQVGA